MERRETVDELKIQIESRQDLEYLRGEFLRAVQSTNIKNFIADPEEAQCFVDGVFSVVQENVQVDGIDYNCLPKELDCEIIDPQMEFKLKELQKKADELLTEVAQLRRDCPTELRSSFESFIADQQKLNLPEFYLENSNKIYAENIQLDPSQLGRLGDELDRLQKLNQSIPDLAAKLERAKAVLDDAPKNGAQSEEHQIINTDQLSEMEARQRQITRQMDLAGRLLSLQS